MEHEACSPGCRPFCTPSKRTPRALGGVCTSCSLCKTYTLLWDHSSLKTTVSAEIGSASMRAKVLCDRRDVAAQTLISQSGFRTTQLVYNNPAAAAFAQVIDKYFNFNATAHTDAINTNMFKKPSYCSQQRTKVTHTHTRQRPNHQLCRRK